MRRLSRILFPPRDARSPNVGMKDASARFLRAERAMTKTTAQKELTDAVPRPVESGVFVAAADASARAAAPKELVDQVTLVVYGWHNVQPGTLSWVFPSVAAAVSAARAMTNAVRWAIVRGRRSASNLDVEAARASGLVLIES